jgi:hypothetical protein
VDKTARPEMIHAPAIFLNRFSASVSRRDIRTLVRLIRVNGGVAITRKRAVGTPGLGPSAYRRCGSGVEPSKAVPKTLDRHRNLGLRPSFYTE